MGWAEKVLHGVSAPASAQNVKALTLWAASEGTPEHWNNWLATTLDGHGGVKVNDAGVKQYPSVPDGVAATVATLRLSFYDHVVKGLQLSASLRDVFAAINHSPWCAGCQGGHYPIRLWEYAMSTMHDPEHVPGPPELDIRVTDAVARKDGGAYVLGADGGVFTFHGAPFYGSYPGLPAEDRKGDRGVFVRIELHPNEDGYTLTDEHGETYSFPVTP